MPENTESKLEALDKKLDAIFVSVEKTRKYFQIIFWITIIMVVVPALGLVFAIPMFINSYMTVLGGF